MTIYSLRFPGAKATGWVLLCLIYLVVRLFDLDRLVTTDEPFWLGASANFYRALQYTDFANTYQLEHPGVPTLWAGTLAIWLRLPEYASLVPTNLDGLGGMYSIESVLRGVGRDPLSIMTTAKIIKVCLQTIYFGFSLFFLGKVAGPTVTAFTGVLIATAPFLTGLDSALHVDGMAAISTFAGFCAIAWASERSNLDTGSWKSTSSWAIAGCFCANAWLSRYPAVLLLGVAGLGLLLQMMRLRSEMASHSFLTQLRCSLLYGCTWLIGGVITTVMLWPALWVAPINTITDMWTYSREAAGMGHENPLIFMGVVKRGDPGWLFYPVSLLWRTTPGDWIGLLALLFLGRWAWHQKIVDGKHLRLIAMAVTYMLVFMIIHSFGAKKFDRYILPVYPLAMLISGMGLQILGLWLGSITSRRISRIIPVSLVVGLNLMLVSSILPYRLDYFNPVLGGSFAAVNNMQMGWGQGGDQVVNFLVDQSTNGPITVQTSAVPSAFTYFLETNSPVEFRSFSLHTPAGWFETDYYVAGIQQTQRGLAPQLDLFEGRTPDHSVLINGVSYFDVYAVSRSPLPAVLTTPTACNFTFGDEVTLMQIVGRDETIDLYFLTTGASQPDARAFDVQIKFPDGSTQVQTGVLHPEEPGLLSRLTIPYDPSSAALADATIVLITDSLSVTAPWLATHVPDATTQSECFYTAPPS